jgi:hypothetical protein
MKKGQMICSELIDFDRNLVKRPNIFKKYFPELVDLTNYEEFMNQQNYYEYKVILINLNLFIVGWIFRNKHRRNKISFENSYTT